MASPRTTVGPGFSFCSKQGGGGRESSDPSPPHSWTLVLEAGSPKTPLNQSARLQNALLRGEGSPDGLQAGAQRTGKGQSWIKAPGQPPGFTV